MKTSRAFLVYLYRHPFARYVLVGGSTFIIDIGILAFLHTGLGINIPIAATASYWISILYNFLLNRHWSFSASEKESLRRHASAYLLLLGFNYLFTVITVSILSTFMNYGIAKVIVVAVQVCWTFPIYNHKIFVKNST